MSLEIAPHRIPTQSTTQPGRLRDNTRSKRLLPGITGARDTRESRDSPPMDLLAHFRILPCGDAAVTVEFGDIVDPDLNTRVMSLDAALAATPLPGSPRPFQPIARFTCNTILSR